MLNIISKSKIWFFISGILCLVSIVVLFAWGLNLGIDFTGGALLEVEFKAERPASQAIRDQLTNLGITQIQIQPTGERGMILRLPPTDEKTHQEIIQNLRKLVAEEGQKPTDLIKEKRFESIGPTIGQELRQKTFYVIGAVVFLIILYIAWAFRKVSKPVASWKFGLTAIIALFHDILIVTGIFVILGKFFGVEVNTPFVAALLTILGYSVNDTIVVFDRLRENLSKEYANFDDLLNRSVNETVRRSINTSLTTLLVLLAIFFFGGATIRYFALALALGVVVGTYSSIFIATPLLRVWERWKAKS